MSRSLTIGSVLRYWPKKRITANNNALENIAESWKTEVILFTISNFEFSEESVRIIGCGGVIMASRGNHYIRERIDSNHRPKWHMSWRRSQQKKSCRYTSVCTCFCMCWGLLFCRWYTEQTNVSVCAAFPLVGRISLQLQSSSFSIDFWTNR